MSGYLAHERLSSSDGVHTLALYLWLPSDRPRGIVQLVHGMREHMGRYGGFAQYLSRHGYIVCGHDHLGHGRTAEEDDSYGFIAPEHGGRVLVRDTRRVTRWVTRRYPELPVFLLGHSMGSFIARIYALHNAAGLDGLILSGTGGERPYMPAARAMSGVSTRLFGGGAYNALTDFLMRKNELRRLRDSKDPLAWLTRDPALLEENRADPYCNRRFTNRAYADLFELHMAACSPEWARRMDKGLPVFLVSGAEDPVGDFGRGVVQVYDRLKMAGALDVRCRLYEGARHEILNELNREEVYYDILCWIEERLPDPLDRSFQ